MANVTNVSAKVSEEVNEKTGDRAVIDAVTDCAREPIHIPGGIQPHGFLFSVTDAGIVTQASENVAQLTQSTLDNVLGQPLSCVLGEAASLVTDALASLETEGVPLYVGSMRDPRDLHDLHDRPDGAKGTPRSPLAIVLHRYQGIAIVELEPARGTSDVFSSMYPLVRTFINRLQEVQSVTDLAALAAQEVQRITGYGRTLVYDFDDEGNGHVLAEALDEGYASYMDQRFPGSDIPAQARALYVRNRIRLIADADYVPARLVPAAHPHTGLATDLTYASLRSVSPVHVQYMKNMGTWSSMSMSIVVRGKLWGLISCHHASARVPPFEVRTACEHIAQVLSLQVEAKEDHAEAEYRLELRRRQSRVLAAMANTDHFIDALANDPRELLALTGSTGAAIVFDGRIVTVGNAPDKETIERLVEWLDTQSDDIYATDDLACASGRAADPDHAGMLALSLSKLFRNYVIWFRAEVVRTLKWAGDPRVKLSGLSASLSPRESFDTWTETVRGRCAPWRPAELETAGEFRTALLGVVLKRAEELAQLALELGRANEELEGFSYTVSHDLRAPLRHIVGFADLLREMESANLSERGRHFVERIITSARFGGKLVDDLLAFSQMGRAALRPQRVDVRALAQNLIADEQRNLSDEHIEWRIGDLPSVTADPVLLQVVLRNLIENAVKFSRREEPSDSHAVIEIAAGVDHSGAQGALAGQVVMFVRDNGVGFDMRYVDKLFGVFQRLHRAEEFEGTGIGLASVKRIVERHGGKAWAEGELGKGATIYFSLPVKFTPDTAERDESAAAAVARLVALSSRKSFRPVPKDANKDANKDSVTNKPTQAKDSKDE